MAFVFLIIPFFANSRAFCAGCLMSGFWLLLLKYPLKRNQILIIGCGVITVSLIILVCFIKPDSSLGRVLIYKISFNIFKDHWLEGLGWQKFNLNYLYYQAAYFKAGNFAPKELLLADNTQFAFNDYWQFILETGIKGIIFLMLLFVIISHLLIKISKKLSSHPVLPLLAASAIITISTAAVTMHVFERFYIQCIFITCFLIVTGYVYPAQAKKTLGIWIIIMLGLSYYTWGFYVKHYISYQKMYAAENLWQAGYLRESVTNYRALYEELKNDPEYLVKYAEVLSTLNETIEAEEILKQAIAKQVTNLHYDHLAGLYYKNGKIKEAEQAYLTAVYMVPNRFKTRYDLFLFYNKTHQYAKAVKTGRDILQLPVKVPSVTISNIRKYIADTLSEFRKAI